MSNRFTRLVELRRLQEEAAANAFAQQRLKVDQIINRIEALMQETTEARGTAMAVVGYGGPALPPNLFEDFYRGQNARIANLRQAERKARQEMQRAMQVWHATRVDLKQTEKLAEKTQEKLDLERLRQEERSLNQSAIDRFMRGSQ